MSGGRWIHSSNLPHAHRNYDLYGGHKVALRDYLGERPYENYKDHQKSSPRGYNHGQEQKTYGERPGNGHGDDHGHDKKYFSVLIIRARCDFCSRAFLFCEK